MTQHHITRDSDGGHKGAFVISQGGHRLATMSYTLAGDDLIIIDHTDVSDALRGTGAGRALVSAAVDWARSEHKHVMPLCPFARAVFDKTPEFSDLRR